MRGGERIEMESPQADHEEKELHLNLIKRARPLKIH